MRVLVVFAHPVETSFGAALHRAVLDGLAGAGHDIDDLDLYAEGFDPVLSAPERRAYHDLAADRGAVAPYVERLTRAEGLVTVAPVWNLGPPAILKGFMDRVFLPGVTFTMQDGRLTRREWFRRIATVTTYGMKRWQALLIGDPPRRAAARLPGALRLRGGAWRYIALYDMNNADDRRRRAFLDRVGREMAAF